jgi:excinuclease ABC subunit B
VEQAAEEKVEYEVGQKPKLTSAEIKEKIKALETEMLKAASELEFEKAAELRDEIRSWEKVLN